MTATARDSADLETFEKLRPALIALAYRMLGDVGGAQDLVQEAWLRWHGRQVEVESPRAFLVSVVTRLCLTELGSARIRHEESNRMHLPEPVDLELAGMGRLEVLDQVSMAFMVMLERLTPPERAVLLLHEVFDFAHEEVAQLVSRSPSACRKLLERARAKVASGRRLMAASPEEHQRLLQAFAQATLSGDTAALLELLAADATLFADGGPGGRVIGGIRNLARPLVGAAKVAAFVATASRAAQAKVEQRLLNGQPALVFTRQGEQGTFAALLLGVAEGKIQYLYFQADPSRLRFVTPTGFPA